MAPSILIFDFGTNEDAAQQARHKVEAWKQGFRLGNKIAFKFEREEVVEENEEEDAGKAEGKARAEAKEGGAKGGTGLKAVAKAAKGAKKAAKKSAAREKGSEKGGKEADDDSEEREEAESNGGGRVRVFVRLDFSDHEKLSHQRWLDRIPAEEPFKSADSQTVRANDAEFAKLEELFESLD
jgi:hypothetical protein